MCYIKNYASTRTCCDITTYYYKLEFLVTNDDRRLTDIFFFRMGDSNLWAFMYDCIENSLMVKFNLQKHLETYHTGLERNKPAEQLIKCKLCEAIFYNKLAWQSHNLLHTPSDLYLNSEADRKLAVTR